MNIIENCSLVVSSLRLQEMENRQKSNIIIKIIKNFLLIASSLKLQKIKNQSKSNIIRVLAFDLYLRDIPSKIDDNNLKVMVKSYQKNKDKYLDFIRLSAVTPYFPPQYPVDFITESQLYYALLLFDVEVALWVKAKKFTFIFPFCDH